MASEKENQDWQFNSCWSDKTKKLWFGPNNNTVLLKFPLLTTVYALNHQSADKMIAFMNQYRWRNINKAAINVHLTCPTCLNYNAGKPVCTAFRHFKLRNGPFEFWQMNFIQLPLCNGYKYVLVMVYIFTLD